MKAAVPPVDKHQGAERSRIESLAERKVAPAAFEPVRSASSEAIGKAVVDGLDLEALCKALDQANKERKQAIGPTIDATKAQDRPAQRPIAAPTWFHVEGYARNYLFLAGPVRIIS